MTSSEQQHQAQDADQAEIVAAIHEQAMAGDARAQYGLGMMYIHGQGVSLNYREGADWLGRAAEQGIAAANRMLGWLFTNGYGVDASESEALKHYELGAEQGDAEAQLFMATCYHFGRFGVAHDIKQMLHWYQQAAEQSVARAQFALGKLLSSGELVERNDEAAFQWLTLAIMNDSEAAKKELSLLSARVGTEQVEEFKQRMLAAMAGGGHG